MGHKSLLLKTLASWEEESTENEVNVRCTCDIGWYNLKWWRGSESFQDGNSTSQRKEISCSVTRTIIIKADSELD